MKFVKLATVIILLLIIGISAFRFLTKSQDQTSSTSQSSEQTSSSIVPQECSGKPMSELTEGPYYKAGSPERQNLTDNNTKGEVFILTGYVLDSDCKPVEGAWLDFWQADGEGIYDNQGYNLRGHQYTDDKGFYRIQTVIPAEYSGRTPHIHFKVMAPGGREITSQLFFPNSEQNQNDSIFSDDMVIELDGDSGTYVIILPE